MLPVSVIVPHKKSRKNFFENFCLPSIKANDPAEIFVEENSGDDPRLASIHRNRGAKKATQPHLCFIDDDMILAADCLSKLSKAIGSHALAYSDLWRITLPGVESAYPPVVLHRSMPWDASQLRQKNTISMGALIRRDSFPGFDETLLRFQDWDLWLTMAARGARGAYVPEPLLMLFTFDKGITVGDGILAKGVIHQKHKLI